MNSKNRKVLAAIFALPVRADLQWDEIESLFMSLGALRVEGRGSRVKFELNNVTALFHRPHNPKTARSYQVVAAKEFLIKSGVCDE